MCDITHSRQSASFSDGIIPILIPSVAFSSVDFVASTVFQGLAVQLELQRPIHYISKHAVLEYHGVPKEGTVHVHYPGLVRDEVCDVAGDKCPRRLIVVH